MKTDQIALDLDRAATGLIQEGHEELADRVIDVLVDLRKKKEAPHDRA